MQAEGFYEECDDFFITEIDFAYIGHALFPWQNTEPYLATDTDSGEKRSYGCDLADSKEARQATLCDKVLRRRILPSPRCKVVVTQHA